MEELTDAGIPPSIIAKDQDVTICTVTRYLKKIGKKKAVLQRFSSAQLDVLKDSQLKNHLIEDKIKENWIANISELLTLPAGDQKEILKVLQGGRAYDFDKQRLLEGKSTSHTLSLHVLAVQESSKKFRALQSDVTTIDDSNTE